MFEFDDYKSIKLLNWLPWKQSNAMRIIYDKEKVIMTRIINHDYSVMYDLEYHLFTRLCNTCHIFGIYNHKYNKIQLYMEVKVSL